MKNYLISTKQFEQIVSLFETENQKVLSPREAMLNLINFLKEKEYSDENVIDVIIELRHQDEFMVQFIKLMVGKDEVLLDSVDKIIKSGQTK